MQPSAAGLATLAAAGNVRRTDMDRYSAIQAIAILVIGITTYYTSNYAMGYYAAYTSPNFDWLKDISRDFQLLLFSALNIAEFVLVSLVSAAPMVILFGFIYPNSTWRSAASIALIFIFLFWLNAYAFLPVALTLYEKIVSAIEAAVVAILFILSASMGRRLNRTPNKSKHSDGASAAGV